MAGEGTQIPGESSPEVIAEAERMGWVPLENFKGSEDRWVDADKFVERGKNELPIMRERLKKYDKTIVHLNTKIGSMTEAFKEFRKHQEGVAQRAYEKALADITEKQRVAVKDGDVAGFEAAEKEKKDLKLEVPAIKDPEVDPATLEFNEWVAENEWYEKNKNLRDYASTISVYLQTNKNLGGKALYDEVKKEVQLRFPDEFENKNRNTPPKVADGGDPPPPKGKKTFAALPPDAQAQCLKFVKNIPGFTKEQYVKDYQW